jgi:hypothetical protein
MDASARRNRRVERTLREQGLKPPQTVGCRRFQQSIRGERTMASSPQGKLFEPRPYSPPKLEVELDEVQDWTRRGDQLHQAIRDAVEEIGHKEVAFLLDIDGSTLSNLINCRDLGNGKRQQPPARLLLVLGAKQKSQRLAQFLAREWGFAPLQRVDELTPEEELRILKDTLRDDGKYGASVLERARVRR